ncbi:MAG: hypothetical protein NT120_03235 [Candidatus Aenigmarchaeota archaeon]|nr:hypothetical protein [Candidatus Aenigmarchaeota archaeon]
MKKEVVESLLKSGRIRIRQKDNERIRSMIKSAEINANVAKGVIINENSATLVFREIYESLRQLGDSKWWLFGYEPEDHEISLETLKEMNIREKLRLNHIDRFRKIRNDANYRGYRTTVEQAKEIIEFWDKCGTEIAKILMKEAKY